MEKCPPLPEIKLIFKCPQITGKYFKSLAFHTCALSFLYQLLVKKAKENIENILRNQVIRIVMILAKMVPRGISWDFTQKNVCVKYIKISFDQNIWKLESLR